MLVNLYAKYGPSSSCGLPNPPRAILALPNCSCRAQLFLNVGIGKLTEARDDKEPYFCITPEKNIDYDLYYNSNEFSNHLFSKAFLA